MVKNVFPGEATATITPMSAIADKTALAKTSNPGIVVITTTSTSFATISPTSIPATSIPPSSSPVSTTTSTNTPVPTATYTKTPLPTPTNPAAQLVFEEKFDAGSETRWALWPINSETLPVIIVGTGLDLIGSSLDDSGATAKTSFVLSENIEISFTLKFSRM